MSIRNSTKERRIARPDGRVALSGVPVRQDDIEPTRGLHWVAKLFRVMAGMLLVLMAIQLFLGISSTVEISYGMLLAEAIRLLIFAGLLWGAGDLVDLFVKSHYDLRAARILLGRLTHVAEEAAGTDIPPGGGRERHPRGDATH
jgi:hypothetical protein